MGTGYLRHEIPRAGRVGDGYDGEGGRDRDVLFAGFTGANYAAGAGTVIEDRESDCCMSEWLLEEGKCAGCVQEVWD